MKVFILLLLMLLGIGLIYLDHAIHQDAPDSGNFHTSGLEQEEPFQPLRLIGWIVFGVGAIPFAVWKATFFFHLTGRHGY